MTTLPTPAQPVVYQERRLVSQWLKSHEDRELYWDTFTLAQGSYTLQVPRIQNPSGGYAVTSAASGFVPTGTVLGRLTASGKLVPYVAGATDGSQIPVGFLFEDANVTSGDCQVLVVKGFCRVVGQELVWDASVNTPALKAAALALLAPVFVNVAPVC